MCRESRKEQVRRKLDRQLDEELEDTFPASDALKITQPDAERRTDSDQADGKPAVRPS
jgi:hypothetical protein